MDENSEVIFDIQNSRTAGVGGRLSNQVAPRNSNYGASQNGSFTAEQPFFDAFVTADKRRAVTWQLSFTNKSGATVTWDNTQSASKPYGADTPYMAKFLDIQSTGEDNANYIVLRYADNLLMEAEAINERMRGLLDRLDPHYFTQLNKEFRDIRKHYNGRYVRLYGFCDNEGF